jgi:imidazole glycerol-phosphate synthase subunit HisH
MLTVIDYGMGNLRSVMNAFASLDQPAFIARAPEDLRRADMIVLPGVGAFGDGMQNLRAGGWVGALEEEVREKGKPFLGLCVGMQLLATTGTEHGTHEGLGWVPGVCRRIQADTDAALRVPHIGWNDVRFLKKQGLYSGIKEDAQSFYFVHSYVLEPEDPSVISGLCSYGGEFAASLEVDNIYATQYHPEKSHRAGLSVLKTFIELQSRVPCLKTA